MMLKRKKDKVVCPTQQPTDKRTSLNIQNNPKNKKDQYEWVKDLAKVGKNHEIYVSKYYGKGEMGVWDPLENITPIGFPVDNRSILVNEVVFDIDFEDWGVIKWCGNSIIRVLKGESIPYTLGLSGGKGVHISVVFDVPESTIKGSITYRKIRLMIFDYVLKKAGVPGEMVDRSVLNVSDEGKGHLIREFGGRKFEDGKFYYKSAVDEIPNERIKIKKKSDVIFPEFVIWNISAEKLKEIFLPDKNGDDKSPENQTELILKIALDNCTFFHDQYDEPYACIDMNGYVEIQPIDSRFFKRWLAGQVWRNDDQVMNNDVFRNIKNILESQSLFTGKKIELHNRVAWGNDSILYDLSNESWEIVKITEKGWTIEDKIIKFRRYTHQQPQARPVPTQKGDVTRILKYLNLKNDDDQLLVLVLLISSFIPDIPHPYPDLYGDKGSAKTTFFKIFKKLIDPSLLETLTLPTNQNELLQQISHHWCAYYDNVSSIKDWQSDCLCRAVTGDGLSKRALYTNDEDIIYNYKRCIGLNGINISAEKPDLLDRGVLIELERIPKNERKADKTFFEEFEKDRPIILGGIFDILSNAIKIKKTLKFKELPRMADFSEWGESIAQALGYEKGVFLAAYFRNIGSQNIEALESHTIGLCLLRLMEQTNQWIGTPTELLEEINKIAGELKISIETRDWPKHPNTLNKRINEIKSNLNEENIIIKRDRKGGKNSKRLFKITKNIVTVDTSSLNAVFGDDGVTTDKNGDDNVGDDGDDKKVVSSHLSSHSKQDDEKGGYNVGDDGDDAFKTFNNIEKEEKKNPNGVSSHPRQKADEKRGRLKKQQEGIITPKVEVIRIKPINTIQTKDNEKNPKSHRDKMRAIEYIIGELTKESDDKLAGHDDVINEAESKGIDRVDVEKVILELKNKGIIYEPKNDRYNWIP